jgi:NAD-dependent deacetylase sirtuin 4
MGMLQSGHLALTELERIGQIGVTFEDRMDYYREEEEHHFAVSNGNQHMSILTQNVDSLHRKAGTSHVTELHGRNDRLQCMQCGTYRTRADFHTELEHLNHDWLQTALAETNASQLRADGDANIQRDNYDDIVVPHCQTCGTTGFLKPDVVFFGDNVPRHRVKRCYDAVAAADGLLCVGTSLAVLSSFRFVREASARNIPICILNVGETRAEIDGLPGFIKIESPAGPTLSSCASALVGSSSSFNSRQANAII